MKLPFLVILMLTISFDAYSDDFRGLSLGSDCSSIEMNEVSVGSNPQEIWRNEDGTYIFDGDFLGYEAKIIYDCSNNILYRGTYTIQPSDIENADAIFAQLQQHFTAVHGTLPSAITLSTNQYAQGVSDVENKNELALSWDEQTYIVGLILNKSEDSNPIILIYMVEK